VAVAKGNIYVGDVNHDLYCLNAQNGSEVWEFVGSGPFESSPAVTASGYLYIGCDDYNVYCLNATDGAEMWHYNTGAAVQTSPAIVNGVLYIGSNDKMYAFGTTHALKNATLSINVQAQNQKTSFLLTISGTLTPSNQSGTVTIYWTLNGTVQFPNYATLSSGAYSLTPKLRVYNGTYQFYASWPGNSQYNAAVSSIWTGTLNTSSTVPEFPDPLILLAMFMLVTLLTVAIYKKRHNDS
jgi:hypothetical protein